MLKKYHQGDAHVIQWDSVLLNQNLTFQEDPITILDRQIQKLRSKEIALVKIGNALKLYDKERQNLEDSRHVFDIQDPVPKMSASRGDFLVRAWSTLEFM
ncbi:hypothetical protein MTR67_007292 [Solanum verrucosum]|uniref:Uncharacterized protein n=1 Tax=Solanum verrucosum TaxID=315347 RepID=A0AAF0PZZ1_SOLVR|nr:hypothetical protein MTR67_007292 [Solanum verrucosum]